MSYIPTTFPANVTVPNGGTSHSLYGAVPPTGNVTLTAGTGVTNWATTASYNYNTAIAELGDKGGSGKLILKGPDADIEMNGKSLGEAITAIEEALLIPGRLNRNTELEKEFADLKALGEQYVAMEKKYQEQKRVWDILKKQDQ